MWVSKAKTKSFLGTKCQNRRLEASLQTSWKKLAKVEEWIFPCYLWTKANPGYLTHPYTTLEILSWYAYRSKLITPYQQMECFSNKPATPCFFWKWRNCSHLFLTYDCFLFLILIVFSDEFLLFFLIHHLSSYTWFYLGFILFFLFVYFCPVLSFVQFVFIMFLLLFNPLFNFHVVLICFGFYVVILIRFLTEFENKKWKRKNYFTSSDPHHDISKQPR